MKTYFRLIICFAAAVSLAAFFSPFPACAAETTEITVWSMGWDNAMLETMAIEFQKIEPKIKVRIQSIPWDVGHEKIITAIIGNIPPDICQIGTTWMSEFVAMDALLPLDELVDSSPDIKFSHFFDGALMSCKFGGKHYALPWYVDVRLYYYRKDLLASYGYDKFPATWREFREMLKKITELKKARGEKGYAASLPTNEPFPFLSLLWQSGGDLIDAEGKKSVVNSPEGLETLKYMKAAFDEGHAPFIDNTELFTAFESGYYPLFYSGPWSMFDLDKDMPGLKGKWATAVCPENKSRLSFIGGSDLAIFKFSKNKEAAFKFLKFMGSAAAQAQCYKMTHNLPSNRKAWEIDEITSYPPLAAFAKQLEETRTPPNVPEWTQISDLLYETLAEMLYKKLTPEQTLEKIERRTNEIISKRLITQTPLFKLSSVAAICFLLLAGLFFYFRIKGTASDKMSFRRYNYSAFIFLTPAIAVMIMFLFLPILSSFIISLTNWNVYGFRDWDRIVFIGFDNYYKLLADPVFYYSLRNTAVYAFIAVPLNISIALFTAVVLNQKFIKFKGLFRLGFFLPVVTTFAAAAVTWQWMYNSDIGIVNWLTGFAGAPPQNWLSDERLALLAIIFMGVWKGFGYNMLIFIAALQTISDEIYEAAEIDGAGRLQQFFYITLPLLKKTTFFVTVMTVIGSLHVFAEPYIMTGGGPMNSTMSIVLYMYNQGFKYYNLGYSSAIAYALFAIMALVTFLQFKLAARLDR